MAESERVIWRDMEEWSRSTMAVGTFSGSPSCIREMKNKAQPMGTTIIITKYTG